MPASDHDLTRLFQLTRILRNPEPSATERVELLYAALFGAPGTRPHLFTLSPLDSWDSESLERGLAYAEDIILRYARLYVDPRVIPVTYYARERRVRRHLDHEFSRLFKELMRRSGQPVIPELIIEEPIYYLRQHARERSFPKTRDRGPDPEVLKTRFHLALSRRLAG